MEQQSVLARIPKKRILMIAACAIVMLAIVMLFPVKAHAAGLFNVVEDINNWIAGILRGICNTMLEGFGSFIRYLTSTDILGEISTGSFQNLLGNSGGGATTVYTLAKQVHSVAVVPLGHSILALVMLVQVIKIAQKIDSTSVMPTVKEIVFLGVFFVVFTFLIDNSLDLCNAVFIETQKLTQAITGVRGGSFTISVGDSVNDIGVLVYTLLFALIAWVLSLVAYLIALVVSYARALQLYVMMAFSPIPLALLGFEETRSSGINFIKSFIAGCLGFTIIIFLLTCFPLIVSGVVGSATVSTTLEMVGSSLGWSSLLMMVKIFAICILLIFGLAKSGSWAKEIMGG